MQRIPPAVKILGVAALVIVAIIFTLQFYWEWRTESILAKAHERGEPLSMEELETWQTGESLPDEGGRLFSMAIDAILKPDKETNKALPHLNELLPASTPLPPQSVAACEKLLLANAKALGLLHEALQEPTVHLKYQSPSGMGLVCTSGYLLLIEALLAAEHSDTTNGAQEQAMEALMACLAEDAVLRSQPSAMAQIARARTLDRLPECLERIVGRLAFTDGQLAQLTDALLASENVEAEWRWLVGHRCLALVEFNDIAMAGLAPGSVNSLPGRLISAIYSFTGMKANDRRHFVDLQERLIQASLLPYHERIQAEADVEKRLKSLSSVNLFTAQMVRPGYAAEFIRHAARVRTAAIGLALERYRLATGALPDSLDALVPAYLEEIPADPYSGGPLHYVRTERGAMVYSFGLNGVDDVGSEAIAKVEEIARQFSFPGAGQDYLDISFRLEKSTQ